MSDQLAAGVVAVEETASPPAGGGRGHVRGGSVRRARAPLTANRLYLRAVRLSAVIVVLLLWQATALFMPAVYISTPTRIIGDLISMLAKLSLERAFISSLWELLVGFVIAMIIGIGMGTVLGRIRVLERAFDPLVSFANATPMVAVLPLMEIWFGVGTTSRVAFILFICLWSLVINTLAGMRAVGSGYRDVGLAFGLGKMRQTVSIFLPAAMPYIFAGLRIALAQAMVGMVLSGQEIGEKGLGGITEEFGTYFQTGHLVGAIATTTSLALFLFWILRRTEKWTCPWIGDLASRKA